MSLPQRLGSGAFRPQRRGAGEAEPPLLDAAAVMASLPVACVTFTPDNHFAFANAAAEQFFCASAAQLRRLSLPEVLAPASPVFGLLAQARERQAVVSARDLTLEGPRLARRGVAMTATPLADAPGAVLATFYDWSAAAALDRQAQARGAARRVAGLAAMLAHEVKNPLSGIRGAAQLLEASAAEGDRELAVLIRDEADRVRALVDRMAAFGDGPAERAPLNIHRVLDHVRRLAESGFAAHIRVGAVYDPSLPPVFGNRDQLVQVMLNLVKNAAEAISGDPTRAAAGEITLMTAFQPGVHLARAEGGMRLPLVVTVRDNGPGIAPEIERALFDPFVTTKAAGSGLGLALASKIIGDHGGMIEVESRPGRTDFRVFLPIVPEGA